MSEKRRIESFEDFMAERAAQQGADLRALVVTVRGLYGPQARFTLTGSASGNARRDTGPSLLIIWPAA